MRPHILLVLAAAILHAARAAESTTPPLFQQDRLQLGEKSERRLLRGLRTNEERAVNLVDKLEKLLRLSKTAGKVAANAVDDFAEASIQKMLTDDKFKRKMFKKWNKYPLEEIKTNVDLTKHAGLLLEYAHKFRSYKHWK